MPKYVLAESTANSDGTHKARSGATPNYLEAPTGAPTGQQFYALGTAVTETDLNGRDLTLNSQGVVTSVGAHPHTLPKTALELLKDDIKSFHNWLLTLHDDLDYFGQFFPDDDRKLGHEALAYVHRGTHLVMTGGTTANPATQVANLSIQRRRDFITAQRAGMGALTLTFPAPLGTIAMSEVTNADQFYKVLQQLKRIRAAQTPPGTVRTPNKPIVWADPRGTAPIVRIPLAYVIDFSADGIPATGRPANMPATGLELDNDMFDPDTDFAEPTWIDDLT